jgi:hypothetical protein
MLAVLPMIAPVVFVLSGVAMALFRHRWASATLVGSVVAVGVGLGAMALSAVLFQRADQAGSQVFFSVVMNSGAIFLGVMVAMLWQARSKR